MSEKTRISLDIPTDYHKQLKALAALRGKTLRQIILESIDEWISTQTPSRRPKSSTKKKQIPDHELWVYDPANKNLIEHIEKGLKQKATIYRGSFAKPKKR